MTPTLIQLLAQGGVYLVGALVLLSLEAIGTRPGERKLMGRHHIAVGVSATGVVAAVAMAFVASADDVTRAVAAAVVLFTFAACEGQRLHGERGALALALAAVCAIAGGTDGGPALHLATFGTAAIALGALSARPDEDATVEAGAKVLFAGAAAVIAVGVAIAAPNTALGAMCALTGLALMVGLAPLHGPRVDLLHGAPPSVAALAALPLLALGGSLAKAVVAAPPVVALVMVALSGLLLPLVALAQVSVRRLFAVLAASQAMLPVAALSAGLDPTPATAVAALSVTGLAAAVAAMPVTAKPASSWEDVSGVGRQMPWRAGLMLFAAAFSCGLPPTAGFGLRRAIVEAASQAPTGQLLQGHTLTTWLGIILFLGGALSALPLIRLALFFFGKMPRRNEVPPTSLAPMLALGAIVAVAVATSFVPAFMMWGAP
jgi:NADH:ubiquinone oxidoreductase subunit 2 (subunit N)